MIWNALETLAFKSLFKHRPLCIFSAEVEQTLELGPDISVPLSSVYSLETSCTQPHFSHALPHAAHRKKMSLTELNTSEKPFQGHFTGICVVAANIWFHFRLMCNIQAHYTAVMLFS